MKKIYLVLFLVLFINKSALADISSFLTNPISLTNPTNLLNPMNPLSPLNKNNIQTTKTKFQICKENKGGKSCKKYIKK